MNEHRYILQPYKGIKTRYKCPGCNSSKKTFVRYIDTTNGEHIADHVGKCNRESNCNYHYTPKQYFQDNDISFDRVHVHAVHAAYTVNTVNVNKPSFIEPDTFKSSLKGYTENVFTKELLKRFGTEITRKVIEKYFIGTSKHWTGSTIFWQIDISGKIRTGKIMLYDENLHRIKKPYDHITWTQTVLKIENFNLKQCLFGEHLLKGNTKPVAIVESEKTAIIASIYLPQFIWLSCGNLNGLNIEKLKVLQGRKVCLFPDLNAYDNWSNKAKQFEKELPEISFKVSDLLERKAIESEKAKGLDIADYLLRFDTKDFQKKEKLIEPINILIDNILSIPTETITGPEFENMNIVWIKTNNSSYDVLFDAHGEPVEEMNSTIIKLASLFEKDFKPALLNGQKCLAHINN
jgi:uncharacterized protein (DUF427 family)